MKTRILQIIDKYKELRNEAWNNYRDVCKREEEEILSVINFKGKCLRIYDPLNETYYYLRVHDQIACPYHGDERKAGLRLEGLGFESDKGSSLMSIWFLVDSTYTYEIDLSNLSKELDNIKEISEEEFKSIFLDLKEKLIL